MALYLLNNLTMKLLQQDLTPKLYLVCKSILAKWLCVCLKTKCLWVRVLLPSLENQILCLFWARSSLIFRQLQSVDSLYRHLWQFNFWASFCLIFSTFFDYPVPSLMPAKNYFGEILDKPALYMFNRFTVKRDG